jgi:hypothetical protein
MLRVFMSCLLVSALSHAAADPAPKHSEFRKPRLRLEDAAILSMHRVQNRVDRTCTTHATPVAAGSSRRFLEVCASASGTVPPRQEHGREDRARRPRERAETASSQIRNE